MANQSQELGMQIRGVFADVVELIPQKARVALYVSAVALAVVALAAQRVVAIWWPEGQQQVDATVAEIIPWALVVIGGLGTAYRPGRGDASPGTVVIEDMRRGPVAAEESPGAVR